MTNKPTTLYAIAIIRKDVRTFTPPPDALVWRGVLTKKQAVARRRKIEKEHGQPGVYYYIVDDETTE